MTKFGETLRTFRESANDPDRHRKRLSQERLGVLIGHELGDRGFSGAAVSDWERGKSKISVEDRNVLTAMIKVLYQCGGIRIPDDADQLLEAGDYRALNKREIQEIFENTSVEPTVEQPETRQEISKQFIPFLVESLFAIPGRELKEAFSKAEEGPSPSWPRKLAVLMQKASARWSISLFSIFWVATWALAWWLITPSLRWPFADRDSASSAIIMYVGGTLAVPLLIGALITTKESTYWKQQGVANSKLLRLYTYQGAGIGFNLGYFLVLPFILAWYYLQLGSSVWLELAAVTLGLILGNMSARVVPHNLWLAYHRLHLADGAIFFVVALLGPLWGIFFLEYYSVLLTPLLGSIVILLATTAVVFIGMQQSRK